MADEGNQFVVTLRVPAAVAGDSRLPGLLKGTDTAALQDQLRIVAADIAHNLDVRRASVTLADPIITARPDASRTSLEVELRYPSRPGMDRFSARVNAFSSKDGPVRTVARYQPGSGREQVVNVTGPAVRVTFDPLFGSVLRQFAVRGLRIAVRRRRPSAVSGMPAAADPPGALRVFGLVAAVVLGQAVATVVSVNLPPMSAGSIAGAAMVSRIGDRDRHGAGRRRRAGAMDGSDRAGVRHAERVPARLRPPSPRRNSAESIRPPRLSPSPPCSWSASSGWRRWRGRFARGWTNAASPSASRRSSGSRWSLTRPCTAWWTAQPSSRRPDRCQTSKCSLADARLDRCGAARRRKQRGRRRACRRKPGMRRVAGPVPSELAVRRVEG